MLATQHDELGAEIGDGLFQHHNRWPEPDGHRIHQIARDGIRESGRDVCAHRVEGNAPQLAHPFIHPYGSPHVTRSVDQVAARFGPCRDANRHCRRPRPFGRAVDAYHDGLP